MNRNPFLSQPQRHALLALEIVLMLAVIGLSVYAWMVPEAPLESKEAADRAAIQRQKERHAITYNVREEPVETFPFDPNTADSTTLLRLGLAPWQVRSIYRYRAKHGRYHTPEDFMRTPGMTNEQWERLGPMVCIAAKYQYVTPPPRTYHHTETAAPAEAAPVAAAREAASRDSFQRQEKLPAGVTVDLNTADTTQLKMIPGIASKRAASIVAYRKALGGFVSVEQAMEAIEMPDSVMKWMHVTPRPVQKIRINEWSVQRLMNHPYLSFYQAREVNEYRRNKGKLQTMEQLASLPHFRPTDIERLAPYIEW